jgi:hypothetical protein
MTTGGDNFQVGEDTVVAKLSVDIPAGTADTLAEINQQTEQLKVSLESVARAQEDWLEYLRQVPQLTEQAAQAQRNLITQLERTVYIQQELGGLGGMAMGGRPTGAPPYSTAAPQGAPNPFAGMTLGMGTGGVQTTSQAEGVMNSMMMNDPRLFANMLAQRGLNPAQLGMMGQATISSGTGGQGQGNTPPASSSPQPTQAGRDSAAPPDQTQSGAPTTSEPQRVPSVPHPEAPGWQQTAADQVRRLGQNILTESKAGGGRGSLMGMGMAAAGSIGSAVLRGRGGGGDGGGEGGDGGDGAGGVPKWLKGMGGVAGIGAMALGANAMFQNAGEQIQRYKNLGGERGGGAVEGAGLELSARTMAMNPFITLEQSRQIMQTALRSGYTGKEFDTLTGFMADNLKNMNMSAADSMKLFNDTVVSGKQSIEGLKQQMKDIHDLSATGRVGQTEKIEQNVAAADVTAGLGFTGEGQRNIMNAMTEGFAEDPLLAHDMPGVIGQAMQNPNFMQMVGREAGIIGALPEEIPELLDQQGPRAGSDAVMGYMRREAQQAHNMSPRSEIRAASIFGNRMRSMGLALDRNKMKELYRFLISGKDPAQIAQDRRSEARGRQTLGEQTGISDVVGGFQHAASAIGDFATMDFTGAMNNLKALFSDESEGGPDVNQSYQPEGTAPPATPQSSIYGPQGRAAPGLPNQASPGAIHTSTQGQVTGQLNITVDQQGRVTAPQTVRLSGNQIAVNSGYGSATLNNPAPGDQNYLHNNRGMG